MITLIDETRDRQYEIALNWGKDLPMNQYDTSGIDKYTKSNILSKAINVFGSLIPAPDSGYVGRVIIESKEFEGVSAGAIMMQVWCASELLFDGERL